MTKRKSKPHVNGESSDRLPPHSPEAESGVLGCILLDPTCLQDCLDRFKARPEAFYDLRHQTIFSALIDMRRNRTDIDVITLQQRLKDRQQLDEAGGLVYLSKLPDAVPSAANLSSYLDIVAEKHELRRIISTCTDLVGRIYDYDGDLDDLKFSIHSDLADIFDAGHKGGETLKWADLVNFDTSRDANNLIGVHDGRTTRYLCRGQAAWLIGPSGVGKSALLLQFGLAWATGQAMFGITPSRPLRVLLIQAENDKGDLAEMARGINSGLNLDFDPDIVEKNIRFRSIKGKIGQSFCLWLQREIEDFRADLVLVDPLLSFAGIDVSRQEQVSQFCRVWLDPVLHSTGAALLSAHHTGKPQRQQNGKPGRPQTLTDLAYEGLGSSELVNWARAVMILQNAGEDTYRLALAKRGTRAWATHPNGDKTLTVWLRHATDGTIFWTQTEPPEESAEASGPKAKPLTKPQQIASLNSHSFVAACRPEGEGVRGITRRLKSWLASKDCDNRTLHTASEGTIRSALGCMVSNDKLSFADGLYFKGKT